MTSSSQDSKNNFATLVCGKWVSERFLQLLFFFLRIRSKFELNSSVTSVCQLVVVSCRIATTVQTREKEFLYIILLPAAVFYQVGRIRVLTSQELQPNRPFCYLIRAFHWWLFCHAGLIISEDPWNALYRAQFTQYGRKKWKRCTFFSLVRFNISLLH